MKNLILLVVFGAWLTSCSSVKVSSDFDREADFASYKTYAFTKEARELPVDDINRNRILDAVSTELAAKGFSESDQPDVWIDMNLATEKKQSATSTPSYYGAGYRYGWGGGFSTTSINIENYVEGTLFVDMIDAPKKQLVWQGRAIKTLDPGVCCNPDPAVRYPVFVYTQRLPAQSGAGRLES